jgi:hypothetical protein
MPDQLTDLKHGETVGPFLLFSGVTVIAVALIARWGEQGFLAPLHEAAFMRSLKYVDWFDVSIHYVPLAVCIGIDVYLLNGMSKPLRFFALAVMVPLILLAYWFLTNDYNY